MLFENFKTDVMAAILDISADNIYWQFKSPCYPNTSLKVSTNMTYGSGGGYKNVKTDNKRTDSKRLDEGKQTIP